MKKNIYIPIMIWLMFMANAAPVLANIDNLSNMSTEWIRTGNRNAATDSTDIVIYNPAALVLFEDGIYLNAGNQSLIRKPSHSFSVSGNDYSFEQDSNDYFLPNIFTAYKKNNWSLFGAFYIPGGGAVVDYPRGSFTTRKYGFDTSKESLKASSAYYTFGIGGAYQMNEMLSFSLGFRYINAVNAIEAELSFPAGSKLGIDVEDTADGYGTVLGVSIIPRKNISIGIQYYSQVDLNFKTDVNKDDIGMFTDGEKNHRDFPGMIGMGIGYTFSEKFYGEFNYSYWFQTSCNWGKGDFTQKDISEMAGNAYAVGGTVSVNISPGFLASFGLTYTKFLWNDIDGYYIDNLGSYEVLFSDNFHVGVGCSYELKPGLKLNAAIGRTIWDDETITAKDTPGNIKVKTENSTTVIAIGIDIAFEKFLSGR